MAEIRLDRDEPQDYGGWQSVTLPGCECSLDDFPGMVLPNPEVVRDLAGKAFPGSCPGGIPLLRLAWRLVGVC